MCFKRGHRFDVDRNRAYAVEHHDNVVPETSCVLCSVHPDRILHVCDGSLFIIDSGATRNMTYESKWWLHNYHPLHVKRVVYLADDTTCQVKGIGDLYLGTLSSSTQVLRGVLHVPDLQRNLLSVARLIDLGLFVGFDHTKCCIEKDGQIIATASRNGNLFELSLNDAVANVVTALQVIMIASYGITALFMLISQSFLIFIVVVLYMVWILKLILIWESVSFVLLANTIVNPFLSQIQSILMICWILFILTFADLCLYQEHNIVISLRLLMITHGIQLFSCLDKNLRR